MGPRRGDSAANETAGGQLLRRQRLSKNAGAPGGQFR
jgi:hypothetical protein